MRFKDIFKPIMKGLFNWSYNWLFNYIDTDKDGKLSKEEIEVFVAKLNELAKKLKKK